MREIKFRAWLLKENKMVDVDTISKNKGYGGALEIFVDNPNFDPNKKKWEGENRPHDAYINHSNPMHKERNNGDDFILLQFTGEKEDKPNGKDIYEGDIITCCATQREIHTEIETDSPVVIKFHDGYFYPFGYNAGWRSGVSEITVIGNVYETPELIPEYLKKYYPKTITN